MKSVELICIPKLLAAQKNENMWRKLAYMYMYKYWTVVQFLFF